MVRVSIFVMMWFLAIHAWAQSGTPAGRVVLTRTAVIEVPAEGYEFGLTLRFEATTAEGALQLAGDAEDAIEAAVEDSVLKQVNADIGDSDLSMTVAGAVVTRKVRWIVNGAQYQGSEERQGKLGALADAFRIMANGLGAQDVTGPVPHVNEKQPYEDEAVAKALRESLLPAASASTVVNAGLTSALEVHVVSLRWKAATLNELRCTARVRISYGYEAGI